MKNLVQWFEIATLDLERAKNFYSNVFEITFQLIEMPGSRMYVFGESDRVGSAGSLIHSDTIKPSIDGTVVYFSCDDVSHELSLVENEGGKILLQKTDIGEFGFFAQIVDTEGNRIGLHSEQ